MSIFLAKSVPARNTHPIFTSHDLPGYDCTTLSSLSYKAIPRGYETAYAGYKANIDIFVSATNRQMKLSTGVDGALLSNLGRPGLPLSDPAVGFVSKERLTAEQEGAMVTALAEYGCYKKKSGQTTIFIVAKPTPALIPFLHNAAKERTNPDDSFISHKAYEILHFMRLTVAEFLATNTYPAFTKETLQHEAEATKDFLSTGMDVEWPYKMETINVETEGSKAARSAVAEENANIMEGSDTQPKEVPAIVFEQVHAPYFAASAEIVAVAKPSPVPATFNYGPISTVPHLPGRAFPYFKGMLLPDRTSIRTLFGAHFMRCFGDSRPEIMKRYGEVTSNLGGLTGSAEGMELSHMLYGINLALESQTRLFLVITGTEYCGFVLLGTNWSLYDGVKWLEPETAEELHDTVAEMGSHQAAVVKLARILSRIVLKDGPTPMAKEPATVEMLGTSAALLKAILRRDVGATHKEEMAGPLGCLAYTVSYKQQSVENITWALREMTVNAKTPLSDDVPIFIPPSLTNIGDKAFQVLCSFGPNAFSFINGSGSTYTIPAVNDLSIDHNEHLDDKGHKFMPVFLIANKGVAAAYGDFRRMIRDKVVVMDMGERAKKNRCLVVSGERRDRSYAVLKECVGGEIVAVAESSSGPSKRKRGDVDDTDRPTTKPFQSLLGLIPKAS